MTDYTFETLNDKEFEVLTVDLLSKEFNTHIERFKSGRDGGIDGRFFEGNIANDVVIIQCKHWLKSGIKALVAECKKHEASKVRKLNPSRYIFVTSLALSAQNKKDISDAFSPYIKNESDIIGNEDLNSLLAKHPDVERQHYKLWLAGTNFYSQFYLTMYWEEVVFSWKRLKSFYLSMCELTIIRKRSKS